MSLKKVFCIAASGVFFALGGIRMSNTPKVSHAEFELSNSFEQKVSKNTLPTLEESKAHRKNDRNTDGIIGTLIYAFIGGSFMSSAFKKKNTPTP